MTHTYCRSPALDGWQATCGATRRCAARPRRVCTPQLSICQARGTTAAAASAAGSLLGGRVEMQQPQQQLLFLAAAGCGAVSSTMPGCCWRGASALGSLRAISLNNSLTFAAVFADVSMKNRPFSVAYAVASSTVTARALSRSALLPASQQRQQRMVLKLSILEWKHHHTAAAAAPTHCLAQAGPFASSPALLLCVHAGQAHLELDHLLC